MTALHSIAVAPAPEPLRAIGSTIPAPPVEPPFPGTDTPPPPIAPPLPPPLPPTPESPAGVPPPVEDPHTPLDPAPVREPPSAPPPIVAA